MREVEEENKHSLEIMKKELKEVIKLELSQMASQHSLPIKVPDTHTLAEHISTKGSCVEATVKASGEEPSVVDVATMGLYIVGDQCTRLMALGKVYDSDTTIHNVPYTNDMVRVSVVIVYDVDALVSL